MDYRAFLGKVETAVLPYFGGTRVDAPTRRYRVEGELARGWWRFELDNRRAIAKEPAPAADLSALPAVRGHWVAGWIAVDGKALHRIALPPDDEPEPLSRITARRWHSGDLVLDALDFEDDAERTARAQLADRAPLSAKGVAPSLRAAFGYALGLAIARELGADVSIRELAPRSVAIADAGRTAAEPLFAQLLEARARADAEVQRRAEQAAAAARIAGAVAGARVIDRARTVSTRLDDALDGAGARLLDFRRIAGGAHLDVTYEVDGTRIQSIVSAATLQIVDPGICLSGAHRVLTLEAMPSVVREAIEQDHLNITRRG